MNRRYFNAPTAEWWEPKASESLAKTVYEPDVKSTDTGLLDAQGRKLFRTDQRDPIGFVHHKNADPK